MDVCERVKSEVRVCVSVCMSRGKGEDSEVMEEDVLHYCLNHTLLFLEKNKYVCSQA